MCSYNASIKILKRKKSEEGMSKVYKSQLKRFPLSIAGTIGAINSTDFIPEV